MEMDKDVKENIIKTGTTTVAIATKSSVVLATDARATMGYFIASKTAQKIHPINDRMALTIAGSVGDAQRLVRWLQSEIKAYEIENQKRIKVESTGTLLANVLSAYKYMPFWVQLLLAGRDENGSHIYSIDMVGGVTEEKYTSTGSGSPIALGIIEANYKNDITTDEAVTLAHKAVSGAIKRDAGSGESVSIAVIDSRGFRFVEKFKAPEN